MKALSHLIRLWQLTYFRWARAEMSPLHADLPYVIRRINELERL